MCSQVMRCPVEALDWWLIRGQVFESENWQAVSFILYIPLLCDMDIEFQTQSPRQVSFQNLINLRCKSKPVGASLLSKIKTTFPSEISEHSCGIVSCWGFQGIQVRMMDIRLRTIPHCFRTRLVYHNYITCTTWFGCKSTCPKKTQTGRCGTSCVLPPAGSNLQDTNKKTLDLDISW